MKFRLCILFVVFGLTLSCSRKTNIGQKEQPDSATSAHFIGRTIEDVEGELGQPIRPPDKLDDGRLWFDFQGQFNFKDAWERNKSTTFVSGWVLIVEKGRVVNASPVYTQLSALSFAPPSPWQATKCVAQFVSVSTTPDEGAKRIFVPGELTESYYAGKSASRCTAGIDGINLQWSTGEHPKLRISIRISKQHVDQLRQFSTQEQGQLVALTLDNQPILVARLLVNLEADTFTVNTAGPPELITVLEKLGLQLPARDEVKL